MPEAIFLILIGILIVLILIDSYSKGNYYTKQQNYNYHNIESDEIDEDLTPQQKNEHKENLQKKFKCF